MVDQDLDRSGLPAPGGSGTPKAPSADGPGGRTGGRKSRVPSPLLLRSWRVRSRMLALVAIPAVAAIVLGAVRIQAARSTAAGFARVDQLAVLGGNVTLLANAVDDERDLTAGFAAASEAGDASQADSLQAALGRQYIATDGLLAAVRHEAAPIGPAYPAVARTDLAFALGRAAALPDLRDLVRTQMPPPALITAYSNVVSALLAFDGDIAAGNSSAQLAQSVSSLGSLAQMEDQSSLQRAILDTALIQGQFGPGSLQALTAAQADEAGDEASFQAAAASLPAFAAAASGFTPGLTVQQQFNDVVAGPEVDEAQAIEQDALIKGDNGRPPGGGAQTWFTDMSAALGGIRTVEEDQVASIVAQAGAQRENSEGSAWLTGAAVLVLLLLVLAVTVVIARSMIVPLRRLRADALDVAGRRLPETVRRLSEGQGADGDAVTEPVGIHSADEIGEVARAFDQVYREAVRLAGDEAMLRANMNAMFVNLSRRSQSLIERQLGLIDALEQSEQDPDRLSSLFRLDHLATRMRRNSENLLVLAGHEAPRKWSQPVPLIDVLRAAVSEIEQYERVSPNVPPGVMVTGRAASDVVHLVAEMVENATAFSPEDTQVLITSQVLTSGGVLLTITDAGLGIPEQDLAYTNWRLDNPPVVDVAVSRRMGLFVVGRLAARHGIRVRLQAARDGGLSALVWLPEDIAVRDTTLPLGQFRRRRWETTPRLPAARQPSAPPMTPWRTMVAAVGPGFPASDEDPRLPIFDAVESGWFRRGGRRTESGQGSDGDRTPAVRSWSSPADDGFLAARAAASPATGDTTKAGLPRRVPAANLVPGRVGHDPVSLPYIHAPSAGLADEEPAEVAARADHVRDRMTGLQRGAREGRAAAPRSNGTDEH